MEFLFGSIYFFPNKFIEKTPCFLGFVVFIVVFVSSTSVFFNANLLSGTDFYPLLFQSIDFDSGLNSFFTLASVIESEQRFFRVNN